MEDPEIPVLKDYVIELEDRRKNPEKYNNRDRTNIDLVKNEIKIREHLLGKNRNQLIEKRSKLEKELDDPKYYYGRERDVDTQTYKDSLIRKINIITTKIQNPDGKPIKFLRKTYENERFSDSNVELIDPIEFEIDKLLRDDLGWSKDINILPPDEASARIDKHDFIREKVEGLRKESILKVKQKFLSLLGRIIDEDSYCTWIGDIRSLEGDFVFYIPKKQIFDSSMKDEIEYFQPYITENGLGVFALYMHGYYLKGTQKGERFKWEDFINVGDVKKTYCSIQNNFSGRELERLRKFIIKKLYERLNDEVVLFIDDNSLEYRSDTENLSFNFEDNSDNSDIIQRLIRILKLCFNIRYGEAEYIRNNRTKIFKTITLKFKSFVKTLKYIQNYVREEGSIVEIPNGRKTNYYLRNPLTKIKNPNLFTIKYRGGQLDFPVDLLTQKSEFFNTLIHTALPSNRNEYMSDYSKRAIKYFHNYVFGYDNGDSYQNEVLRYDYKNNFEDDEEDEEDEYPYSFNLDWIGESFDIELIPELFEMIEDFLIVDESYGVELLIILYYVHYKIEDIRGFLNDVATIVVPDDWARYEEIFAFLERNLR